MNVSYPQPPSAAARYAFRLFVTGATPRSQRALRNLRALCEEHFAQHYEMQVIDIYQQPELAREVEVIAAPTLLKDCPPPPCRMIGDLSDRARVLSKLRHVASERADV